MTICVRVWTDHIIDSNTTLLQKSTFLSQREADTGVYSTIWSDPALEVMEKS